MSILLLTTLGVLEASAGPVLRDVTAESGLSFTTTCGALPSREILEVNGGGLALLDFDRDGDLDVFVANGATLDDPEAGPGSRLYENISTPGRLRFTDVTEAHGISLKRWAMGATAADYDGDGHVDLFVTCYGPNVLLRNTGTGTFEDVTQQAGLLGDEWSTSAAFGDLDADGDLDLYVVNYLEFDHRTPPAPSRYKGQPVMGGPHGLEPTPDVLYENLGDGTFRNATASCGVAEVPPAFGLNLVLLDMNADGHLDILVGNDSMPNHLLLQQPEADGLRFDERGRPLGIASNMDGHDQATMGMAVADVNGDRRPDVFTTNFSSDTNTMHIAAPDGMWDDRTMHMGLGLNSRRQLGWASAFADLDHDGDEDLLMVNGHVYPQATLESMDSPYEQTPTLLLRDGRRFTPATTDAAWLRTPHRDRNLLLADLDRDGDLDALIGELNGPVRILENKHAGPRRGMLLSLHDARPTSLDHAGLGSRLDITVGDATMTRWIPSGGCYQSGLAPEAHIAVPDDVDTIDITVHWPDGSTTRHEKITPSGHARLERRD